VDKLQSRADWERYRDETRRKLADVVGPFPEKTELNPRVTGVLRKDSFRVEKIIYGSQPGFHVTACALCAGTAAEAGRLLSSIAADTPTRAFVRRPIRR
jgi:hypothetical protein